MEPSSSALTHSGTFRPLDGSLLRVSNEFGASASETRVSIPNNYILQAGGEVWRLTNVLDAGVYARHYRGYEVSYILIYFESRPVLSFAEFNIVVFSPDLPCYTLPKS